MKEFVAKLISNEAFEAKVILDERLKNLVNEKLNQIKMRLHNQKPKLMPEKSRVRIYPSVNL